MATNTGVFSEEHIIRVNNGPTRVLLFAHFAGAGMCAVIAGILLCVYFFTDYFHDVRSANDLFNLSFYLLIVSILCVWLGFRVRKKRKELVATKKRTLHG